jgi:hypothetical protein
MDTEELRVAGADPRAVSTSIPRQYRERKKFAMMSDEM